MKHVLEMKYPSSWWHDMWREGLVTGNGFTGASLYGGAKREILQIGRHDFWIGGEDSGLPDVHEAFGRMRRKMEEGSFREASWEIVNELKARGYSSELEAHVPLARMVVEQTPVKGFRKFIRRLDMENAVAGQQWMDGDFLMRREVFVSREQDTVIYRLTADDSRAVPGGPVSGDISYSLELNAYRNDGETPTQDMQEIWDKASVRVQQAEEHTGYLYFNSKRDRKGAQNQDFGAVARVVITGGEMHAEGGCLKVNGSKEVLITIKTYVEDQKEPAWLRLFHELSGEERGFDELLSVSADIHRPFYHSAQLSLGRGTGGKASEEAYGRKDYQPGDGWGRCNEDLVMEAFSERQSTELVEKLWHYGRYLFLCGTNPDANPFPLYGLWGGTYRPMWCHNMANENLQMIYWHSLCGNLTEYNRSIFQYMNQRISDFQNNAARLFGINGIYMTAGTTPGVASPTQVVPVIINWTGAAGWIAQHYYQYFLYTRDMDYALNIMLPYMDGVAGFYEEFVRFTGDENGEERILFYPSVSPENTPENFMPRERYSMAHPMPTTINSTIDLAILKEFFTEMLDISEMLEEAVFPEDRVRLWKRILRAIPEYRLNGEGAVREWQEDMFEDRYDHRHLSHIYPVFPGCEYYPEKDPEKIPGFMKAVKLRKIDAQTGWSMAHMAAVYARFRDGAAAMECLDNMAKSSLLPNFFTLHNDWRGMNISLNMDPAPVQLDAVMGYVNAVQEMLLYVSPGYIALLPALEERLYEGELKNFRYHDGAIDMKWNVRENVFEARIRPLRPHRVQILLPDFVRNPKWSGAGETQVRLVRRSVWEVLAGTEEISVIDKRLSD